MTDANEPLRIYSTVTCPKCHVAKDWMKAEGIAFVEVDVTEDFGKQRELITLTKQRTVPVFAKGDRFVVGFDPAKVKELAAAA